MLFKIYRCLENAVPRLSYTEDKESVCLTFGRSILFITKEGKWCYYSVLTPIIEVICFEKEFIIISELEIISFCWNGIKTEILPEIIYDYKINRQERSIRIKLFTDEVYYSDRDNNIYECRSSQRQANTDWFIEYNF